MSQSGYRVDRVMNVIMIVSVWGRGLKLKSSRQALGKLFDKIDNRPGATPKLEPKIWFEHANGNRGFDPAVFISRANFRVHGKGVRGEGCGLSVLVRESQNPC